MQQIESRQQNTPHPQWPQALAILKRALPGNAIVRLLRKPPLTPAAQIEIGDLSALRIVLVRDASDVNGETDSHPVLVLRTRHPRERERQLLRGAGHSFIDLAGAVHISAPGFFLDRSDLPAAPAARSAGRGANPYTDVASRVVRTLLLSPKTRAWSIRGLAKAAEVDPSTASRTIRELRRRELVRDERIGERRKSRIRLPDPEALLEDWARAYTWLDNAQIRLAAPVGSIARFIARMPELLKGERWSLTLQAGASVVAPHAAFKVVHTYVHVESDAALEEIALERRWNHSPSGKLVLLRPRYKDSVWFRPEATDRISVVSPVQLAIDLWHYPVRGREQAQHLIETVLRPIWDSDNGTD